VRFAPHDRAFLAALLTSLPREVLHRLRLLIRPDTVLRRHRETIENLVMDLDDAGCRARYLRRDRDGKFPALMDEILAEADIKTVITGILIPRMNSITERWVQSCRRELLDRCLLWNERHLRHALREYERFYNHHRAHQALDQAAPLRTRLW
jgi:putative transposase